MEMAYRPTEARAHGADNISPPYAGRSEDGLWTRAIFVSK